MTDLYHDLGLDSKASAAEIKKAYRQGALKYHPDKNPGNKEAEEKFKSISRAYEILSDPERRTHYDQTGDSTDQPEARGGHPFGDMFQHMFEQHAQAQSAKHIKIIMSLSELQTGASRPLTYYVEKPCTDCEKPSPCKQCGGKRKIVRQMGPFQQIMACQFCRCKTCQGQGIQQQQVTVDVTIPSYPPSVVKIAGQGNYMKRGGRSDLLVHIAVGPHDTYELVEGKSLRMKKKISLTEALTGFYFFVESVSGELQRFVYPPHRLPCKPGTVIQVPGLGLAPGDKQHYLEIHFEVEFPEQITSDQVQTLRQMWPIQTPTPPTSSPKETIVLESCP